MNKISNTIVLFIVIAYSFSGCGKKSEPQHQWSVQDSIRITDELFSYREAAEAFFRNHPQSPFNQDSSTHYTGIKWYPPDLRFCFTSKLFKYYQAEHVTILGTKGEERNYIKYGYFTIQFNGEDYKLVVYKEIGEGGNHLSIWFTDETTGKETYGVGRYVDLEEEHADPGYVYTIDFNKAYNPYCAYSARYSCAVPRQEDHLPFAVTVGEKKYHE